MEYTYKGFDVTLLRTEGSLSLISEMGTEIWVKTAKLKAKKVKTDWRNLPSPETCSVPTDAMDYFLQPEVAQASSVRLHTALYGEVVRGWQAAGELLLPNDWRAIAYGTEGGEPMQSIAATLRTPTPPEPVLSKLLAAGYKFTDQGDGSVQLHNLSFVRRLLLQGQPHWRVTLSA